MARKKETRNQKSKTPSQPWTPWGKWALQRRKKKAIRQQERQERRAQRQQIRKKRRQRRRRLTARGLAFLLLAILSCLISVIFVFIIGRPYPWQIVSDTIQAMSIEQDIAEQRTRWERLAVHHYTVDVFYRDEWWYTRCGPVQIEVLNGEIIDQASVAKEHWRPAAVCDTLLEQLTIDRSFDRIQSSLDSFQPATSQLSVQFDPEFGFPVYVQASVYGDSVENCCWTATWENFQPIDE